MIAVKASCGSPQSPLACSWRIKGPYIADLDFILEIKVPQAVPLLQKRIHAVQMKVQAAFLKAVLAEVPYR
ncbi:MAG: hypothetical protein M1418_09220 [Deltaproteobacteria bacterium]|nr:hypothetical protein [Deltaproteobacteria bacterium]